MKNLLNVQNVPVVNASNTIVNYKGFNDNEENWQLKNVMLNALLLLSIFFLLGVGFAIAQPTAFKGGNQHVPSPQTGGANNESKVDLVNNTGSDLWDIRITLYKQGKIKKYSFTPAVAPPPANDVNSNKTHVLFTKKIAKGQRFQITITMTAPNDSIAITPTDSLHADLLVDLATNSTNSIKNKYQPEKPIPGTMLGGKQVVNFDASNFPAITFENQTGQDVCDMKITNARDAAGNAIKIDEVYADDKKVDSAQCNGSKNFKQSPYDASSVHINFPCVANGGKVKITLKFKGVSTAVRYDLVPTNKDSADIIVSIQPITPSTDNKKVLKKVTFGTNTDGTAIKSGLFSFTVVNLTGQNVCDLILQVPDGKKIKKVKVNDKEWTTNPPNKPAAGKVHVFAGANPCIPNGDKITVTVWLESGEVAYCEYLPTNANHDMILLASLNGTLKSFEIPNNFSGFGLTGRSGSLVAINESCSPISQLTFTSPNPGIFVTAASSTLPSIYDAVNHVLTFLNPVMPDSQVDVHFVINALLPYSPTDTFPYTTIELFAPGSEPFAGYPWWSITPASNSLAANGSIDITTNGSPGMTFLWSNGSTDEDLNNIPHGNYTLTITSPSGCMFKEFNVPAETPQIEILPYSTLCPLSNTGGGFAMVTGMVEPLVFLWDNGETTRIAHFLNAGPHGVTVIDGTGFILGATTVVQDAEPVAYLSSIINASCYNTNTGSINLSMTSDNSPFRFVWSNGKTTEDLNNIKAGTYNVAITNGFGCINMATFNVQQPAVLTVGMAKVNVTCGGLATGKATANVTGGTSPYAYNWSNGVSSKVNKNIPAGVYTVSVSDANGCSKTKSVIITQNPPMFLSTMQIGPNMAMANVSGGLPPYTFMWNTMPPQFSPQAVNLMPGIPYTVVVTDAAGCTQSSTIIVGGTMRNGNGAEGTVVINTYPNPAEDLLNVNASVSGQYELQLIDASGKLVFESSSHLEMNQSIAINVSDLANGMYALKVTGNNEANLIKVMIKR